MKEKDLMIYKQVFHVANRALILFDTDNMVIKILFNVEGRQREVRGQQCRVVSH